MQLLFRQPMPREAELQDGHSGRAEVDDQRGLVPGGMPRSWVWDTAVIGALAVSRLAVGCKNTLRIAVPLSVVDSRWPILSTVVVRPARTPW